jgi:hypothetical protein
MRKECYIKEKKRRWCARLFYERERKKESGTQEKIVAFNQYLLDVCVCFVSSSTIDDDDFQIVPRQQENFLSYSLSPLSDDNRWWSLLYERRDNFLLNI